MVFYDLPLDQLSTYLPAVGEPEDFDDFWAKTVEQSRAVKLDPSFRQVDFGLSTLDTFDVTFNGYGGQPIKGWLILPHKRQGKLPCIMEFIGYGSGRSYPTDWLIWGSAGYAHFVMDTRGQGSAFLPGDTPDMSLDGSSQHFPGFMTLGVLSPETYYYKRVFIDAVRAVDAARSHPEIDPDRIAVTGASQGGGIAIAISGLVPSIPIAMPDVPFLCNYRRATEITDEYPYQEIVQFLHTHRNVESTVFHTLAYFDGVCFASRAKARALFSVGLMDTICPPSTVYAAYNHWAGKKEMRVYRYNKHEGGGEFHKVEKVRFLNGIWKTG